MKIAEIAVEQVDSGRATYAMRKLSAHGVLYVEPDFPLYLKSNWTVSKLKRVVE